MTDQIIVTDKTKQNWVIASVCFAACIVSLDNYIVNISLPTISHYFNVSTGEVSLVTMIYLLIQTSCLITCGKIGDKYGIRNIFVLGYIIFTIGSLLCGIAPSITLLVIARCIQAIGGSILYALSFAIIPRFLPHNINGRAFGMVSAFAGLGMTLGAPLGGIITAYLSWHGVFLINVPIGIAAIIVTAKVLPKENIDPKLKKVKFDIQGAILLFISLALLFYALNTGQESGWSSFIIISSFTLSLLTFIIFIIWELKSKHQLVDLVLFKDKRFVFASIANVLTFMLLAGSNFLLPFYLVMVKGLKSDQAGFVILTYSIVYLLVCPFVGRFSDKIQPTILAATGMFGSMLSCIFLIFTLDFQGLFFVFSFLVILGVSYGCFMSPNNNFVTNIAPPDKTATASAYFKTLSNLSQVLGVCIFETIFSEIVIQNTGENTISILELNIKKSLLLSGFEVAYIFGAITCLIAAICFVYITYYIKNNSIKESSP